MQMGLADRVAVVFAASKGLGKAAANSLALEGCKVAICSRSKDNINQAAQEIREATQAEILPYVVDVEKNDDIQSFVAMVLQKWKKIDILVTNAGGPAVKTFDETTDEEWQKYFNITFMSVVRTIRAVLPSMKRQRWGRIINITSISVKEPIMSLIYSNTLRLAVVGLAQTLSKEVGRYSITVHNVAPGYHRTEGLERIVKKRMELGEKAEDVYRQWEKSIPLQKIGQPEELAALITFLASEQSSYMTGTTIQVDGGRYSGI
jgi:3-oxoacyl-[acyl-carrier protein] reductase